MQNKIIELYTDGACSGNPGVGGWGAILMYKTIKKTFSGCEQNTTNNRMELLAVIKGLQQLKESCIVNIFTDSAYVFNAFDKDWINDWQNNGWKTADKKELKNLDLWQQLIDLNNKHKLFFNKVKGHADNVFNNECDKLATSAIKEYKSQN